MHSTFYLLRLEFSLILIRFIIISLTYCGLFFTLDFSGSKYGDYGSMVALFATNFAHRGKNMDELGKSVCELWPLLQEQITTSVMKKIRVGMFFVCE